MRRALVVLVLASAVGGCASPEAMRTRGGGPGADLNNRPRDVKMHGGSDPFWNTPQIIAGTHVPLDSARQAKQLSTR